MPWISPLPDLVDGPLTGPDRPMLEGVLAEHRATLLSICAGLTGEQLATHPVPSTNLSLLGLIRHMAKVERVWFRIRAAHQDVPALFDPALGIDHDFDHLDAAEAGDAVEQLTGEWRACDLAVAGLDFDAPVVDRHDNVLSLRRVYVHMISEYARHLGHADLLREAIDGVTDR